MRRVFAVLLLASALLTAGAGQLFAQDPEPLEAVSLFAWATGGQLGWGRGGLLASLGVVGALVMVFSLVGGAVPGTAGFARVEAGLKRVEEREKILDEMLKPPTAQADEIKAVEAAVNNLRDDIRDDRRRQFLIAAILYAFLGAFFAAMLTTDLLQALVIGAGWTAYIGALGLKKDYADRKAVKDDVTERLEGIVNQALEGVVLTDSARREASTLLTEARVSKAL